MPTLWKFCLTTREHPQRFLLLLLVVFSKIKNNFHRPIYSWDVLGTTLFHPQVAITIMILCPSYLLKGNPKSSERIPVPPWANKFTVSATQFISWLLCLISLFHSKWLKYSRCKVRWSNLCSASSNIGGTSIIKTWIIHLKVVLLSLRYRIRSLIEYSQARLNILISRVRFNRLLCSKVRA